LREKIEGGEGSLGILQGVLEKLFGFEGECCGGREGLLFWWEFWVRGIFGRFEIEKESVEYTNGKPFW